MRPLSPVSTFDGRGDGGGLERGAGGGLYRGAGGALGGL